MKNIDFGERLKHLRNLKGLLQTDAARLIGISYSSLQNHESGCMPSQMNIQRYSRFYECDKNWLITGIGVPFGDNHDNRMPIKPAITHEQTPQVYKAQNASNIVEFQHIELVKNFKDKERAKAINSALLELENLSPEAFEEIESYIKGMVRGLQLATGQSKQKGMDRRQDQRRTHDNQDTIPEEGDRRQGKNRRAVNGN